MSQTKLLRVRNFGSYFQLCKQNNIHNAADLFSKTEIDLMYILDLSLEEVKQMMLLVSQKCSPSSTTPFDILQNSGTNDEEIEEEFKVISSHLPTKLNDLDEALGGGIPFGSITEVVGPPGIGKTQFCLTISLFATFPREYLGLSGSVIYFDTEFAFSSERLLEIANCQLENNLTYLDQAIQSIIVYTPTSPEDLLSKLQALEEIIIERNVKLIVIDSIAFARRGYDRTINSNNNSNNTNNNNNSNTRPISNNLLGKISSLLKYLAENFKIPVLLTNQVTSSRNTPQLLYHNSFEVTSGDSMGNTTTKAALGTTWAHCVNTRLILHPFSDRRMITIAKSPISPVISFPYFIDGSGVHRSEEKSIIHPSNYWDFPIEARTNPSTSANAQHHITFKQQNNTR